MRYVLQQSLTLYYSHYMIYLFLRLNTFSFSSKFDNSTFYSTPDINVFSSLILAVYTLFLACFYMVLTHYHDGHSSETILGHSGNYMLPILVPFSVKRIATQILVIAKLNGRKDFILRGFVCDIIRLSKELPVQS